MIASYIRKDILRQVERDRLLLREFCEKHGLYLENVLIAAERAPEIPYEAMYVFDDGLGGYTIDGIEEGLKEKE